MRPERMSHTEKYKHITASKKFKIGDKVMWHDGTVSTIVAHCPLFERSWRLKKKGYTSCFEDNLTLVTPLPVPPKNRQIKEGTFKPIGEPEHPIPFSFQEIQTICKLKHYRMQGFEGAGNYSRLQDMLREKGFTEDQVKQCLHP